MKNIKTTVIIALIGAAGAIIAALISKYDFGANPEKESGLHPENIGQLIPDQQNQAEKVENNQKKEIHVQGDYVEGDKFESTNKKASNSKKSLSAEIDLDEPESVSKEPKEDVGNVISINQSGGQIAHKIINNYAHPQRLIPNETSQILVSRLMKYKGKRFKIYVSNNDLEGINLAKRLKNILIDSGWIEAGFTYNLAGFYPPGIHIEIGWEPTEPDQVFGDSMLQLTDFKINTSKNEKVEDLSIVIGPNPE